MKTSIQSIFLVSFFLTALFLALDVLTAVCSSLRQFEGCFCYPLPQIDRIQWCSCLSWVLQDWPAEMRASWTSGNGLPQV